MKVPFHNLLVAHDKMHYKGTRDFPHRRAATRACTRWLTDSSLTGWITAPRTSASRMTRSLRAIVSLALADFTFDWYAEQQIGELVIDRVRSPREFLRIKIFPSVRGPPPLLPREPYYEFNMIRKTVQYITNFLHFFGIKREIGEQSGPNYLKSPKVWTSTRRPWTSSHSGSLA